MQIPSFISIGTTGIKESLIHDSIHIDIVVVILLNVKRSLVLSRVGLLTLGAHAQRGYLVCHSVRLSGTPYSAITRNSAAKKRYQRVQYHTVLIFKIVIFIKVLRSRVMA